MRFAVSIHTEGFNLHMIGVILMIIGALVGRRPPARRVDGVVLAEDERVAPSPGHHPGVDPALQRPPLVVVEQGGSEARERDVDHGGHPTSAARRRPGRAR